MVRHDGLPRERLNKPLILVVEDNADGREMYTAWLQHEGFRAVAAQDGQEALDLALRLRPDLIVMDLALPVIDGVSVTRLLKARTETAWIPVIAITAYDPDYYRDRAIEAGCATFLPKPFELEDLLGETHRLIATRRHDDAGKYSPRVVPCEQPCDHENGHSAQCKKRHHSKHTAAANPLTAPARGSE